MNRTDKTQKDKMEEVNYEIKVEDEYDMLVKMTRCIQMFIKRYGKKNIGMMSIRILKDPIFLYNEKHEEIDDKDYPIEETCMIDNDSIAVTLSRQALYRQSK